MRDRGLNLAPLFNKFWTQNRLATGGAKDKQFDIHILPGTFGAESGSPNHYTA